MGDQMIPESNTQKKRFLKRYRKNLACLRRLERKLEVLNERLDSIKSPDLSGMPRGGVPVDVADLISDKMDLEKRIKKLKAKSDRLKAATCEAIDSLEDDRYCEILEAHYIDGLSFADIADELGYTERHIYILYAEAISLLSVNAQ